MGNNDNDKKLEVAIFITFIIFHSVKKMVFYRVFVGINVLSCFQRNR